MSTQEKLSDESVKSLIELGEVLRSIVKRLVRENKAKVVDGKIIFLKKE